MPNETSKNRNGKGQKRSPAQFKAAPQKKERRRERTRDDRWLGPGGLIDVHKKFEKERKELKIALQPSRALRGGGKGTANAEKTPLGDRTERGRNTTKKKGREEKKEEGRSSDH